MRAIVIKEYGPVEGLVIQELPEPQAQVGQVLIQVKAFGINHAEMHMRRGEWAESMPVPGIECAGIVKACPGGEFAVGAKVVTLMGGLGRTVNGSYAEYTVAPASNVVQVNTDLSWEQLAAIPETYATAWTCLFRNLELKKGQTLLVRGATSSFGQAAINLAVNAGVKVVATTRNKDRFASLENLGASRVELEGPELSTRIHDVKKFDAVLNLVGNSVLLDSLQIVHRGGRVCLAGFLGGLAPVPDFNPLLQMASGVHFSFFGSFVFGASEFPLSDVPLQTIIDDVAEGRYQAKPSRVFDFDDIHEAHRVMEANQANGKMVVLVP